MSGLQALVYTYTHRRAQHALTCSAANSSFIYLFNFSVHSSYNSCYQSLLIPEYHIKFHGKILVVTEGEILLSDKDINKYLTACPLSIKFSYSEH